MNPTKIAELTEAVIAKREEARVADEAKKQAEAEFITALEAAGLTYVETPEGKRVAVEARPRRKFDVGVLADYLAAEVLALVLKEEVDPKALDAAVTAHQIDPLIAEKATTVTYSTQVRVYGDRVVGERS